MNAKIIPFPTQRIVRMRPPEPDAFLIERIGALLKAAADQKKLNARDKTR